MKRRATPATGNTPRLRFAAALFATIAFGPACAAPRAQPASAPTAGAEATAERAQLAELNRGARTYAVVEQVAGLSVDDPYRALEQDSELTRAWVTAQTARTEHAIGQSDPAALQRLTKLMTIGALSDASIAGQRTLVLRREGERDQPALYALQDGRMPEQPSVDPLQFGAHAAFDWFYLAPDGRRVAFGISNSGDERATLRVLDLEHGVLLPDTIEHAKWCNLAWLNDASGFYYTRYPTEGEPDFNPAEPDSYFPRVFFHRLGSAPQSDVLVFRSERGSDVPSPSVSDDDRYLVVTNHRGFTASDVYLLDRGSAAGARALAPNATHPLRGVIVGRDKLTSGSVHHGKLYLLTNQGAPRGRLVTVAPEHATDINAWHELVPEAAGTLTDFGLLRDAVALHYIQDVRSRLLLLDLDGKPLSDVALPAPGSIESLSADAHGSTLAFTFSSYFYPPALFHYDSAKRELTRVYQVAHDLDTSAFAIDQQSVPSADGTPINVYYVHKAGLRRDKSNPVLVYGYGGFDVSLLPQFTRSALYFIERGGVYAVANLRGGGEGGETWHRAGMFENKPHVFEDFEAVVRWFAQSEISQPDRIAVTGGSNGGLLVGALLTRAPDAFRAAAAYVGLYDMLRYTLFPPAQLWISEYGDPQQPEAARYLYGYSPYHHVTAGTHYPAALIETADHDTRVHFAHSTKFAARLQEAQAGPYPIYFFMEREQGHGHGTPLHALVERYARMYAFIEHELGMKK